MSAYRREIKPWEELTIIDDYMDYYNNDRGQWQLSKLSPNEYYEYCITGKYPLITYSSIDDNGHLPRDK